MAFITEIIRTEQLSDGAIGITVRANGDPKTDAVLTMYNVVNMTPDAIQTVINKHHQLVAARALAMDQAKAQLTGLKQTSVTHKDTDLQAVIASQQPVAATVTPAREIEVPAVVPVTTLSADTPAPNLPEGITLAPAQPAPQPGQGKAAPSQRGR